MKIAISDIEVLSPSILTEEAEREVKELADSIKEQGMSHPIIVRHTNNSTRYALVSGEKRILAHQMLELTEIEAEVRDVDETGGKILRLHENIKRTNLPWWETALLVEELHRLRQQQHGKKENDESRGRPTKQEGKVWGIRETAQELGRALGPLSEDLQLARAIKLNPSLRNVRDRRTAVKLVRVEAQRQTAEREAALPTSESVNQAFFGDSESVLKHFPDKTFDHCITDPPWLKFYDEKLKYDDRTLPVFREVFRVLKNNAFLLMFCGLDDYHYYCGTDLPGENGQLVHTRGALEKIGFQISKTPAIWKKESALSRRGVKSWEYDRDFEFVIVAVKGSPAMVHPTIVSAIKSFPIVPVRNLIHPNEKPVEVVAAFLEDISYEGNIILDPFGGSFVTGEACKKLNRRWVIIERDPDSYKKGCKRLDIKE